MAAVLEANSVTKTYEVDSSIIKAVDDALGHLLDVLA